MISLVLSGGLPVGGSAAAVELPPWAGPTFTLLGVLGAALIGLVVKLLRGPVEVKDLWAENRLLRADVDLLMKERKVQQTFNRVVGRGYDALSNVVERMTEETGIQPKYLGSEHDDIAKARALLLDISKTEPEAAAS